MRYVICKWPLNVNVSISYQPDSYRMSKLYLMNELPISDADAEVITIYTELELRTAEHNLFHFKKLNSLFTALAFRGQNTKQS